MGLPSFARYAGGAEARVDLGHAAQGERAPEFDRGFAAYLIFKKMGGGLRHG